MSITVTLTNNADPAAVSPQCIVTVRGPLSHSDMVLPAKVPYDVVIDTETSIEISQRGDDQIDMHLRVQDLEKQVAALQAQLNPPAPDDAGISTPGGG